MTYEETLHYLYTRVPVFQHSGASAYKPGLGTSIALDAYFNYPHSTYKTIHVAGTNGKALLLTCWLQHCSNRDIELDYILHLIWSISVNVFV